MGIFSLHKITSLTRLTRVAAHFRLNTPTALFLVNPGNEFGKLTPEVDEISFTAKTFLHVAPSRINRAL
jgi:hypothetical protein